MPEITTEQKLINTLEEAKNIVGSRADLFIIANRRIIVRLFDSSRTTANNQLLLLAYSFENFDEPFKAYYDRLFSVLWPNSYGSIWSISSLATNQTCRP
jgi:hypothetical protein